MAEKQYDISISSEINYISEQSLPEEGRYVFAYTITVTNTGQTAATLLRRHWLITDANCKVQEVRGEGVVGEQPILNPGEKFEYTSGTPLSTPSGFMGGHYEMETNEGKIFEAIIPQFSLDSPFIKNNLN